MTHMRTVARIFVLAIGLNLCACSLISWTRVTLNRPLEPADVAFIRTGTTTFQEVVQRLGAPTTLTGTPDGMRASYSYYDGKRFGADLGAPAGYFLPPGASLAPHQLAYGSDSAGTDTFEVMFDNDRIAQYAGFNRSARASSFTTSPLD
jgi:hypothetical protein